MKATNKKLYDNNIDDFGNLEPYQIMALTIYAESRGEKRPGKIAVGTIILERVEHREYDGDNIVDVCLWPYQFSCYLPKDPNRPVLVRIAKDFLGYYRRSGVLMECSNIAKGIIDGTIPRDTNLALVHCCQYITGDYRKYIDKMWHEESNTEKKAEIDKKRWWKEMKLLKVIEHHEFYI